MIQLAVSPSESHLRQGVHSIQLDGPLQWNDGFIRPAGFEEGHTKRRVRVLAVRIDIGRTAEFGDGLIEPSRHYVDEAHVVVILRRAERDGSVPRRCDLCMESPQQLAHALGSFHNAPPFLPVPQPHVHSAQSMLDLVIYRIEFSRSFKARDRFVVIADVAVSDAEVEVGLRIVGSVKHGFFER